MIPIHTLDSHYRIAMDTSRLNSYYYLVSAMQYTGTISIEGSVNNFNQV